MKSLHLKDAREEGSKREPSASEGLARDKHKHAVVASGKEENGGEIKTAKEPSVLYKVEAELKREEEEHEKRKTALQAQADKAAKQTFVSPAKRSSASLVKRASASPAPKRVHLVYRILRRHGHVGAVLVQSRGTQLEECDNKCARTSPRSFEDCRRIPGSKMAPPAFVP
ncbi:hypothetical protein CDD81_1438 [Ophiocordyceps australis]|uniref:Uncharacterized protein n=1 Tax=Ophiocordyceps australis TaxID=1399860 RepID=A0A2C5Y036_9HYPO|nr:hypothetical protein CDD81_1438 [Ophiocordyceps australis]